MKRRKRRETSKTVLGSVLIFCGAFSIAVLVGWFNGLPDVLGMLGIVSAIATLVVKYYMEKAAKENIQKIKQDCGKDI